MLKLLFTSNRRRRKHAAGSEPRPKRHAADPLVRVSRRPHRAG